MLGDRYRAWVRRTPLLIAVGAEIRADHKIPEIEQILSVGAAAMNMLNAIHMLGYGGMWVTGVNTYDPHLNALLGFGLSGIGSGLIDDAQGDAERRAAVARRTHDSVERLTPTTRRRAENRRAARRSC